MFATYLTRIYSSPQVIDSLVDYCRDGTIFHGVGLWQGEREDTAVMEVVGDEALADRLISRACKLAELAGEDSILATASPLSAAIITATGERLPVVGAIRETIRSTT